MKILIYDYFLKILLHFNLYCKNSIVFCYFKSTSIATLYVTIALNLIINKLYLDNFKNPEII